MKKWLQTIYYSFPIKLILTHLQSQLIFIGLWIILLLFITGGIGNHFGISYLFLNPVYLGTANYLSFFIIGAATGSFIMTWNLTSYLLEAYRFPFLASLARPFNKFVINNVFIPLFFIVVYVISIIRFQFFVNEVPVFEIIYNLVGFGLGLVLIVMLTSLYLNSTNEDISYYQIKNRKGLKKKLSKGVIKEVEKIKSTHNTVRVDTFLKRNFKPRLVRDVQHYDNEMMMSVFKQNHLNSIFIQMMSLFFLIVLGYLIDNKYARIPAGANVFMLFNIIIAMTGSITYWFGKWRFLAIIFMLIFVNTVTKYDFLNHKNKAYGLDYDTELPLYDAANIKSYNSNKKIEEDKEKMIGVLNNWRAKFGKEKPKLFLTCVTGGGLKAAVWAMKVLQYANQNTHEELFNHTVLVSGASGGVIGTSYFRELYLQKKMGANIDIYDPKYVDFIARDLLNSVTFTIITTDLFIPWTKFYVGDKSYKKDRGYIFEKQLNINTENVFTKNIVDYRKPEQDGIIPMLFITPSIVNDGRRLIISPLDVSFMTSPPNVSNKKTPYLDIDCIEFRSFFKNQDSDSLTFTSALRMNATYPYILPNVFLPSIPNMEVMDAGFRDNYGVKSAVRFMHVFKDWIRENTDGVVLLQISGRDLLKNKNEAKKSGNIESIFSPLDIVTQTLKLQQYDHSTDLGLIHEILGKDNFEILNFVYAPSDKKTEASLSFHLTKKEKESIVNAIDNENNQQNFERLFELLNSHQELNDESTPKTGKLHKMNYFE